METIGNKEILKEYKIGFFCSKNCPPELIPKIYDWAIKKRDEGAVIISGFHTLIEKDVLKFLLKGTQPIIICPARSLHHFQIPAGLKDASTANRLLFISTFDKKLRRVTKKSSHERNKFIIDISDEIVVGYAEKEGNTERLLKKIRDRKLQFVADLIP